MYLISYVSTITGSGNQLANESWFPLVDVWEESGYHQMFWSSQNEEWYTKRVDSIRNGGNPRNLKHWRDVVRGRKDVRKIRVQYEKWSEEELKSHLITTR